MNGPQRQWLHQFGVVPKENVEAKVEKVEQQSGKHEHNWTLPLTPTRPSKGSQSCQEKLATCSGPIAALDTLTTPKGLKQGTARGSSWSHAYFNSKSNTKSKTTGSQCFTPTIQSATKSSMFQLEVSPSKEIPLIKKTVLHH